MRTNPTFFWYDLETFGLNSSYDKIAQFAGQRTDMNLNPIGPSIILYCKPPMDYLPGLEACLVTGITPQETMEKGLPEDEFISKILAEFSVPNTIVCGFNTIAFDDEFIRNALYRNFFDPYSREYTNGCSRWDILDLVRATHDLRPDGINWPPKNPNTNNPVFKLTEMTKANNIEQIGAHDAMVDVFATIAVAKLILQKQPRLFNYYLGMRDKLQVKNLIGRPFAEPVVYTSRSLTSPNGCTTLVVPITPLIRNQNTIVCFDLSKDITPLLCADEQTIMHTPGLQFVTMNKCPAISPLKVLKSEDAIRLGIDTKACMARYEAIRSHSELITKIRKANELSTFPEVNDPDFQLYSGFFTPSDQDLFGLIRNTPVEQRLRLNLRFRDPRCSTMLFRQVCRNHPEVLDPDTRRKWLSQCASRILCPPGNIENNLNTYERKIEAKLSEEGLSDREINICNALKTYSEELKKQLFD